MDTNWLVNVGVSRVFIYPDVGWWERERETGRGVKVLIP